MPLSNWDPILVLTNVSLSEAIGCELAALAPSNDPRVAALKRAHPPFRRFLQRFSDSFGERFEPVVLILNSNAPPRFRDVEALARFRDLVAISAITRAWSLKLLYPGRSGVLFGEAFDLYPWMLDRNYEDLYSSTLAFLGVADMTRFKGQSSPALIRGQLGKIDLDQPLQMELMKRWHRHYAAAQPLWEDVKLMRSLNMAYHASRMPAGTETTFYDIGRVVSLWISAFEILAHPGGEHDKSGLDKVFCLIEKTSWICEESSDRSYDTRGKKKNTKERRTLASWIYEQLYKCRNDFLHGNPVDPGRIFLPSSSKRAIFEYAASLYRIALGTFLQLNYKSTDLSLEGDIRDYVRYLAEKDQGQPQKEAEKALLTAKRSIVGADGTQESYLNVG